MEPSYPALLQSLVAGGMSISEAQRSIHRKHPGLRRAYEQSQKPGGASASASDVSGVPADVVRTIREIEASKSPGAASPDPPVLNREALRQVMGVSKKEWTAREQARGNTSASGTVPGGERDYFELIREVKARRGCDFATAAHEVNRTHPRAWAEMLSRANGGRDFSDRIKGR